MTEANFEIFKNPEDFFSGYSKQISRELMRIYKDLELVEHLGSGLNRILTAYIKESFEVCKNQITAQLSLKKNLTCL